jgi:hypothetical protein
MKIVLFNFHETSGARETLNKAGVRDGLTAEA